MINLFTPKALVFGLLLSLAPLAGGCAIRAQVPVAHTVVAAPGHQAVYMASPQPVYVAPAPQPIYYHASYASPAPHRIYVQPAPMPRPVYHPAPPRVLPRPGVGVHGHVRVRVGRR